MSTDEAYKAETESADLDSSGPDHENDDPDYDIETSEKYGGYPLSSHEASGAGSQGAASSQDDEKSPSRKRESAADANPRSSSRTRVLPPRKARRMSRSPAAASVQAASGDGGLLPPEHWAELTRRYGNHRPTAAQQQRRYEEGRRLFNAFRRQLSDVIIKLARYSPAPQVLDSQNPLPDRGANRAAYDYAAFDLTDVEIHPADTALLVYYEHGPKTPHQQLRLAMIADAEQLREELSRYTCFEFPAGGGRPVPYSIAKVFTDPRALTRGFFMMAVRYRGKFYCIQCGHYTVVLDQHGYCIVCVFVYIRDVDPTAVPCHDRRGPNQELLCANCLAMPQVAYEARVEEYRKLQSGESKVKYSRLPSYGNSPLHVNAANVVHLHLLLRHFQITFPQTVDEAEDTARRLRQAENKYQSDRRRKRRGRSKKPMTHPDKPSAPDQTAYMRNLFTKASKEGAHHLFPERPPPPPLDAVPTPAAAERPDDAAPTAREASASAHRVDSAAAAARKAQLETARTKGLYKNLKRHHLRAVELGSSSAEQIDNFAQAVLAMEREYVKQRDRRREAQADLDTFQVVHPLREQLNFDVSLEEDEANCGLSTHSRPASSLEPGLSNRIALAGMDAPVKYEELIAACGMFGGVASGLELSGEELRTVLAMRRRGIRVLLGKPVDASRATVKLESAEPGAEPIVIAPAIVGHEEYDPTPEAGEEVLDQPPIDNAVAAGVGPKLPLGDQDGDTADENRLSTHSDLMSPTVDEAALLSYRDPATEGSDDERASSEDDERISSEDDQEQEISLQEGSHRTAVSDHNYAATADGNADSQHDVASQTEDEDDDASPAGTPPAGSRTREILNALLDTAAKVAQDHAPPSPAGSLSSDVLRQNVDLHNLSNELMKSFDIPDDVTLSLTRKNDDVDTSLELHCKASPPDRETREGACELEIKTASIQRQAGPPVAVDTGVPGGRMHRQRFTTIRQELRVISAAPVDYRPRVPRGRTIVVAAPRAPEPTQFVLPSAASAPPRVSGATRCSSAPASPSRYQGRQSVVIGPWAARAAPQHARGAVTSAAVVVAPPATPGRRSSTSAPSGTNPLLLHPVPLGPQMPSPRLSTGQGPPITYTPPVIHVRPTAEMMGAPLNIPLQDILSHIQLVVHLPTTPVSTPSSPP